MCIEYPTDDSVIEGSGELLVGESGGSSPCRLLASLDAMIRILELGR